MTALENILESIIPGTGTAIQRTKAKTASARREKLLEQSGFHVADPSRTVISPVLLTCGKPVLVIECFRNGRYISSSLFRERDYVIHTSVSCSLPPFTCTVKQGVPRMIKSPVALPLDLMRSIGNAILVCDGTSLHSRKTALSPGETPALKEQLHHAGVLEDLVDSISHRC